jgi:hypothetical protein
MTSRDFCYWLQGFFEVNDAGLEGVKVEQGLIGARVECIKRHLNLVFKHEIDPSYGSVEERKELQAIHDNVSGLTTKVNGLMAKDARIMC